MKKQMRLLIVASALVLIVFAYLILAGRRTQCDTIFEQTATRVGGNLEVIKNKGEFFVGREQVQALTEGSQKVALHLKSCCLSQQTGRMNPDQFQNCINGARDYESKILVVTNLINEAQAAKDQGNAALAEQKASQAREAANAVDVSEGNLGRAVRNMPTEPSPQSPVTVKGAEKEPNNTILEANVGEVGSRIDGEIAPTDDLDFFKFQYHDSKNRRDILVIHIENHSSTLVPALQLSNEDKALIQDWTWPNAGGANFNLPFVAQPGKTYYLGVGSQYARSSGKYTLSVMPQKAYDQYEPNDDVTTATPLQLGQTIEANIMDSGDVDWYHLSGTKEKSVTVRLENGAEAFWPKIQVRDADKSVVQDWLWPNARGANLQFSFPSEPGKDYYVIVAAYESGSSGKYRLSTR